MSNALKTYAASTKTARTSTPLGVRTPGRTDEVKNNAGSFVFEVSDKTRLERFLILGTDGGTYYVGERKLTDQNVTFLKNLIARDEALVVSVLRDIAVNNRAPKNGPSIFALALLLTEGKNKGAARAIVNDVVRTGTHLFEFATYIDSLGGWGRAKRGAVADWYAGKTADQLAYQAVKYRQREGWTHRDLFRKAHVKGVNYEVGNFILGKGSAEFSVETPSIISGFQEMQRAESVKEVVRILGDHKNLPWETIPTQFLTDKRVWETLFYNGAVGQTALLRNVTRFQKIGAFDDPMLAGAVAKALADAERIAKGRVHPVAYANALGIYRRGEFGVNAKVAGALEAGFYNSFKAITPANKATMISLDVSGSMTWASPAGLVGLTYMDAAAVMAMVTLRTEPYAIINGFSSTLQEIPITDSDSLETVMNKVRRVSMGATNVGAPMVYAKEKNLGIDTFAVYTDNETNRGTKPSQALVQYRQSSGRNARLAVVGMAGTPFTVADPKDNGMMDFVGFDSTAPSVLADFSAGRI